MLRPATPLTILLAAAFALLLVSVLSVPIIELIPLGSFKGTNYGVFGLCPASGSCTSVGIGYNNNNVLQDDPESWDLPASARNTLSAVLIIHPVAAGFTLVLFVMAIAAHFHEPAHSTRYMLVVFIFTLLDFLVCLACFLIDVLLFVPHMAWGSYLVLAATILLAICGLVTCAMRRTLVGRKDRQKRIAENAEMSGENYYNREAQKAPEFPVQQPTLPTVSGGNGVGTFTAFEKSKPDQISEENIPLTRRTTASRSPVSARNEPASIGEVAAYNRGPSRSGSRDQYGNPINEQQDPYMAQRGPSREGMRRGRGDMGPPGGYRGGRGGYDNYGPPMRGRGPSMRGSYGPRGGRGGHGPPSRGAPYGAPGGRRGGRSPPPGYGNGGPGNAAYGAASNVQPYNPSKNPHPQESMILPPADLKQAGLARSESLARAESPPPLPGTEPATVGGQWGPELQGQPVRASPAPYGALRDSDVDVAGMVGLQQGQMPANRHDTYMSEASRYSTDEHYVPPRTVWNQGRNPPSAVASPLVPGRPAGNEYYEDVDPRFASNTPPGGSSNNFVPMPPPIEPIYEDVHQDHPGARSPSGSEKSTFTSISQRGVNPRWKPDPPPPLPSQRGPPMRKPGPPPAQKRQDMILDNPDFKLGGGSKGPGILPGGGAYPTGRM